MTSIKKSKKVGLNTHEKYLIVEIRNRLKEVCKSKDCTIAKILNESCAHSKYMSSEIKHSKLSGCSCNNMTSSV